MASACPTDRRPEQALLDFSRRLDRRAAPWSIDEPWLVECASELARIDAPELGLYWLAAARLTELALVRAGLCADGGELTAVGDLLLNPRLIHVHIKGRCVPVEKERHTPLTVQFASWAGDRGVKSWLKHQTTLQIVEKPILTSLRDMLAGGGRLAPSYLESVDERMQRIADTVNFVACSHGPGRSDFGQYAASAAFSEAVFVQAHLCRFDTAVFQALGREIETMAGCPDRPSRFLAEPWPQ